MLAGLVLLEILSISLFAAILTRQQTQRVWMRAQVILAHESASLASQVSDALEQQRPGWISSSVKTAGEAPNVALATVTDPAGNVLFVSKGDAGQAILDPDERAQIPLIGRDKAWLFTLPGDRWEAAWAIYTKDQLRGYTWVEFDPSSARQQLFAIQRDTLVFGVIWVIASAILVLLMGRSIAQPLSVLHRGAAALMNSPEDVSRFTERKRLIVSHKRDVDHLSRVILKA